MKIKISKILLILSVCGLLYSCDKFFEVDLKEQMDEDKVVNNEDYLARLWAGLYWAMENGFTAVSNGGYASACDEADNNQQSSSVQKFNTGSWNAQSNPDDLYSQFYQAIRSANDFLRLSDTVNNPQYAYHEYEKGEPEKYATKVFNWHAYRLDASFLKAYYHFELWKRYGDIAIADKLLTESEALALERTPGQEVVEYIVHVLDSLAPMYDELETMKNTQYTNGKWIDNQYGRITKGAVLALKARVLLYAASPLNSPSGQYDAELCDRAARAAADVINLGLYSTNISYRDMQFDRSSSNPENILDNRPNIGNFNSMETWNYPKGGSDQYVTTSVGSNATCPSQNLVDAYETVDGSAVDPDDPYANRDPRFYETILCNGDTFNDATVESFVGGLAGINNTNCTTTGYYLKKFVQDKVQLPQGTTVPHVWYLFRYGEILLNYAEAMFYAHGPNAKMGYVTNGGDLSALEAVNQVRARDGVDMPPLTSLDETKLRNERRIELAFEGHRFWDVRRWKIAETTENQPLMGMRIIKIGDRFDYNVVKVEDRTFRPAMYRYPIPFAEKMRYPSWEQNEGW